MQHNTRWFVAALVMVAALVAGPASAQTLTNPTKVEYVVSADHATLTKYVIGYFLPGATDPVQTADLVVAAPDAQQKVEQPINAVPLGYATYVAKIKAVAGAVSGEWSLASNEFSRVPFPTGAPVVKK